MLRNYLKIAIRNLWKQKLFSATNIVGLSIGVLCCLLILMYVGHELSYDKWNINRDRIVRPYSDINFGGTVMNMAVTGAIVAPDAAAALPEIVDWCRFRQYGSYLIEIVGREMQKMQVEEVLTVDSSFFNLFPVDMLEGDPNQVLTKPHSLVISESLAHRLFSSSSQAIGQQLLLDGNVQPWEIAGVFKDLPSTTHFEADMLLAMNGNEEVENSPPFWASNNNFHTYLLLRDGTSFHDFQRKFIDLSRQKLEITSSTLLGMTLEEFEATGQYARFDVQPLTDIHLRSQLQVELRSNGDIKYVWIFSSIALFVLLIACINFMNLTTAKSTQRSKEIGVRKVMGSNRRQLIYQFLSEAIVIATIAVVFALMLSLLVLPWYNNLTGIALTIPWSSFNFWLALLGGIFFVGLLAGSYPAFFLSAFRPIKVLRAAVGKRDGRDQVLRNGLVVFQFIIATALIIGTFLIYQQLNFIQEKKLGFQRDQIAVVRNAFTLGNNIQSFKQQVLQDPAVEAATVSAYLPIPSARSNSTYSQAREFREDLAINMDNWYVDHDYADTYQLTLKEGRFFDPSFGGDSNAVVLNEAAIAILGYQDPLGKKIYGLEDDIQGTPRPEDFVEYTIIGIVEDFHFESLREEIEALGFFLGRSTGSVSVRYQAGKTDQVLGHLERTWNEMAPSQPFAYRFVDESFAKMYEAEQRIGKIIMLFSLLAILVSCLGLFGLSTFVVEHRTKEIGIRKVLGASIGNIVSLLSRQFIWLVLMGILIAIPITWYALGQWLDNFAYRIDVHWTVFLLAGLVALGIAMITVSFQSLKAAVMNPVKAIKDE